MCRSQQVDGPILRATACAAAVLLALAGPSFVDARAEAGPAQVSDDGALVIAFVDADTLQWSSGQAFQRYNLYRGDLALLRSGRVYTQDPDVTPGAARFCQRVAASADDPFVPAPGAIAFYLVTGWIDGIEWSLGTDSAGRLRPNAHPCPCGRPFVTVLHESLPGVTAQRRMIDSLADWCAFLPAECGTGLIDFDTEVALVSALGGGNSCSDTSITCVEDAASPDAITAYVEDIVPGPGCNCLPIATYPAHVVRFPRPVASAAFVATSVPRLCP